MSCIAHPPIPPAGLSCQEAAEKCLAYMENKLHSTAGVIVLDKRGNIGKAFTSEAMIWAYMKDNELHHGLFPREDLSAST